MERKKSRLWKTFLLALITIRLWVVFAPLKLGGKASYIMISGGSMEPNYDYGDLVITQKTGSYSIGEAVAYYDPLLDGVIYHRIVDQVEDRFVLKGDANEYLDSYDPWIEDVLGEEWVVLPGFGLILETARQPGWLAVIAVTFVLMALLPESMGPDLDTEGEGNFPTEKERRIMGNKQRNSEYLSLTLAVAGLGLIGLIYFLSRPATELVESFSTASHIGEFSYTAKSDEAVYEDGTAKTGDPIFRNVSHSMTVTFDYNLDSGIGDDIQGEYQFNLVIQDDSGWEREVNLVPKTEFSGGSATFEDTVFFFTVEQILNKFEKATLVDRGAFVLRFVPQITLTIHNGEDVLTSSFSPELSFVYTPLEVKMMHSQDEDVLYPVSELVFSVQEKNDSVIHFLNIPVPISGARIFSGIILAVSLIAAAYIAWTDHQNSTAGGHQSMIYEYGDLIVEVDRMPDLDEMISVQTIDDLVSLANRHLVSVMHLSDQGSDYYFLKLPWGYYYFRTDSIQAENVTIDISSQEDDF